MSGPRTRPWRRVERRITGRFTLRVRPSWFQLAKAAAAAILTWFVCAWLFDAPLPIFGAIAALIVMQDNVDQSLTKGIERVVGVLVGVSVALGAGTLFGPQPWLFIAAIVVAMGVGWLLRMTPTSTNQVAISALLMIALGGLQLGYGIERLFETAIGATIGVLINALVVAPVQTSAVREAIASLTTHTAEVLRSIADGLEIARDREWLELMMADARALARERTEVHALLRTARESLRFNPRSRRYRQGLAADDAHFQNLQHIVTQVIGMARALSDNYAAELVTDRSVLGMAEEMRRAAHDLELLLPLPDAHTPSEHADTLPALTKPYTIPQPHRTHWVLIGSLMEDLRRVRGRITGQMD